jgi:hypothetical protein
MRIRAFALAGASLIVLACLPSFGQATHDDNSINPTNPPGENDPAAILGGYKLELRWRSCNVRAKPRCRMYTNRELAGTGGGRVALFHTGLNRMGHRFSLQEAVDTFKESRVHAGYRAAVVSREAEREGDKHLLRRVGGRLHVLADRQASPWVVFGASLRLQFHRRSPAVHRHVGWFAHRHSPTIVGWSARSARASGHGIDIGVRSLAFPVTPPCVRVRTRIA